MIGAAMMLITTHAVAKQVKQNNNTKHQSKM